MRHFHRGDVAIRADRDVHDNFPVPLHRCLLERREILSEGSRTIEFTQRHVDRIYPGFTTVRSNFQTRAKICVPFFYFVKTRTVILKALTSSNILLCTLQHLLSLVVLDQIRLCPTR